MSIRSLTLTLCVGVCLLQPTVSDAGCPGLGLLLGTLKFTGKAVVHTLKVPFYPAFGIPGTLRDGIRLYRSEDKFSVKNLIRKRLHKDRIPLSLYGLLGFLARTTGSSYIEHESATEEFDEAYPDELTVVVDAFQEDDPFYVGAGTYVYEQKYKGKRKRVILIRPKSFRAMVRQLLQIAKTHGPIQKMDYFGHGFPDYLDLRSEDPETASTEVFPNEIQGTENGIGWFGQWGKNPTTQLNGVFALDARLRFNSCFLGNGVTGEQTLKGFGSMFLDKGGIIYASRVQLVPNLAEIVALKTGWQAPSNTVRWASEPLSVIRGVLTADSLWRFNLQQVKGKDHALATDGPFLWEKSRREIIPPRVNSPEELFHQVDKTHEHILLRMSDRSLSRHRPELEAGLRATEILLPTGKKSIWDLAQGKMKISRLPGGSYLTFYVMPEEKEAVSRAILESRYLKPMKPSVTYPTNGGEISIALKIRLLPEEKIAFRKELEALEVDYDQGANWYLTANKKDSSAIKKFAEYRDSLFRWSLERRQILSDLK